MSLFFLFIILVSELYLIWTLVSLQEILFLQIHLLGALPILILLVPFYLRGELYSENQLNLAMKMSLAVALVIFAVPLFQLIDVWEIKDSWRVTSEHIFMKKEYLWLLLSAVISQAVVFGVLLSRRLQ